MCPLRWRPGTKQGAEKQRRVPRQQHCVPSSQASRGGSAHCHSVGVGMDFVGSDADAPKGALGVCGCVPSLQVGTFPPPAPWDTARMGTSHVLASTSLYRRKVPLSRGGVGPKYPPHLLHFRAPQIILFLRAISDRLLGPSKQPCVPLAQCGGRDLCPQKR